MKKIKLGFKVVRKIGGEYFSMTVFGVKYRIGDGPLCNVKEV